MKPSQGERVYPQHAESLYFVTVGCRVPPLPPPQSGGNFFFLKNFNFCPLRGGRSRFSDSRHLFGVEELFKADISLLMFDPPRADRLAVIRRRRRDFRRFLLKSFSRIFSQEGTLLISFFAFFISLYMYISESVIISDSLFQKTAFSFRRLVYMCIKISAY